MNNFEKIKQMNIDEMVEFLTNKYDGDFTDGYCNHSTCYSCKISNCCEPFKSRLKQWLESEEQ